MSLQTMGEHRHADLVDVARVNPKLLHIWISTDVWQLLNQNLVVAKLIGEAGVH